MQSVSWSERVYFERIGLIFHGSVGICRPTRNSFPRDLGQERYQRRASFLDYVQADQGPVSLTQSFHQTSQELVAHCDILDHARMGSSSMAAGPGGKSALKVGEKVEQKAAGGCC